MALTEDDKQWIAEQIKYLADRLERAENTLLADFHGFRDKNDIRLRGNDARLRTFEMRLEDVEGRLDKLDRK